MLSRLHVKNYILMDSLEIDFPEGLVIVTGQTGAGKSILLGALSLVMGSKADASMIAEDADTCVVEAEFNTGENPQLRAVLEENDVDWDSEGLIVRRVISRAGRSRSFINDCPVSVQVLNEISPMLIDIHSQHQTRMLTDRKFQLGILDHYAGNAVLLEECSSLWKKLMQLRSELSSVEDMIASLSRDREYNEAQFRQLEAASLRDGELAELEEEQKQLANAEEIKMCLSGVEELFTSASSSDALSIDAALKEADRLLSKVSRFLPSMSEVSERVSSCRMELSDILSEVSSLNARTDISESRLELVESRMSQLYGLFQKHGCADEAELIALRDRLSETLFDSEKLEEKRDTVRLEISKVEAELSQVADRLHEARVSASEGFARSIEDSIRFLELPYAVFDVSLSETSLSANGYDAVQFLFSASGRNAVDVSKCASGGEMSRIMLSLKAMMARYTNMPTMIFDEIDTGVSGSVADKMGSMICEMGADMQVFAITHLPQVAAKGDAHYLVSKHIDPSTSKAVSSISRISGHDRVLEVARMLSGSIMTDAAIENAKSLLGAARL